MDSDHTIKGLKLREIESSENKNENVA